MGEKPKHMTSIGGQAIIEGVMMRGPQDVGIAVRTPDGTIVCDKRKLEQSKLVKTMLKIPFLRGVVALVDSMAIGMKALMFSADFFEEEGEENDEPGKFEKFLEKKFGEKLNDYMIYFSVFIAILMSIGLFMLLPTFITNLFKNMTSNSIVLNLIEGVIRVAIFLGYILIVSKMDDIKRVFEYHGAEHKTIHCYESGDELTVENVKKYSILHPRCGTSFLFNVMIISIILFSFFGWPNPLQRFILRILLFPVIGGIAYELNKIVGRSNGVIARGLSYPGRMIQKFATTREPDDSQIEVAIEAAKLVIPEDKELDKW